MRQKGPLIPWFRKRRAGRGTVYLLRSRDNPRLFKVGYTKRKTTARRAELNRVANDNMAIVYTVSLPWARACETHVLRKLRRSPFRKGDHRGTEWFHLKPTEDIERIIKKMDRSARDIRRVAMFRFSWPRDQQITSFRASNADRNVSGGNSVTATNKE